MVRTWRVDHDSFTSTILNQIYILCKRMSVHLGSILVTSTQCALIPRRDTSARARVGTRVMERPVMMSTNVQLGCTIVMIMQHARIQRDHSSATAIRISVATEKNVSQRTVYSKVIFEKKMLPKYSTRFIQRFPFPAIPGYTEIKMELEE